MHPLSFIIFSLMLLILYRYPHIEKDHLVKLLKQLLLNTASPSLGMNPGSAPNAADVPTLLGRGSFSLLSCMCNASDCFDNSHTNL